MHSSSKQPKPYICLSAVVAGTAVGVIFCRQYKLLTEVFLFKQDGPDDSLSFISRFLVRSLKTCWKLVYQDTTGNRNAA